MATDMKCPFAHSNGKKEESKPYYCLGSKLSSEDAMHYEHEFAAHKYDRVLIPLAPAHFLTAAITPSPS